jgi:hypothetical protein
MFRLYCLLVLSFCFLLFLYFFVMLYGSLDSPDQAGVLHRKGGEYIICHNHYIARYQMIINKQTFL